MSLFSKLKSQIKRRLSPQQLRTMQHYAYRMVHGSDLARLARAFHTDKEGGHHYTQHYDAHFRPFRKRAINVLEIGIGGYNNPREGGKSLRMWKAYFPKARIFGIDIEDKSYHDEYRIKTFQGSQVDEPFLRRVVDEIGEIHIIIDDGSHFSEHIIQTFKFLFPLLAMDGIYAIEDLQTSYWNHVAGQDRGGSEDLHAPFTSMNFLKGLVDGLNFEEFVDNTYQPTYFDRHIVSMHFYHNLAFLHKGLNNEGSNLLGRRFW